MKDYVFIVDGVKGKQRPRARVFGGHAVIYTPKETKSYEKEIAKQFLALGGEKFDKEVPVRLSVDICMEVPKTASKKKKNELLGLKRPMKKPDADNVLKCVMDGLNGVAYEDDSQVVELVARKYWAEDSFLIVTVSDASL